MWQPSSPVQAIFVAIQFVAIPSSCVHATYVALEYVAIIALLAMLLM